MEETLQERLASMIANDKQKENLGHINLHEARALIKDAGAIFLDVRPPAKVEGENAQEAGIKNAYYMPYPAFDTFFDRLPEDKKVPIITGCVKGWYGNRVMGYLEALGYANVYVLDVPVPSLIEVHHAHVEAS